MDALRNYLNKIKPKFEEGGRLHALKSVFDGFETFLYVPNETSRGRVNVHDPIDSKRIMSIVVIALLPAMLFGMSAIKTMLLQVHLLGLGSGSCSALASWLYCRRYW